MNMETVEAFLNQYGYIALFIGVLIDQSGFPIWVVFAGIFSYMGIFSVPVSFGIILLSLTLSDIFWYYVGSMIYKRHQEPEYLERYTEGSMDYKIYRTIVKGTTVFSGRKMFFYLLSKTMPIVGKFVPVFAGNNNEEPKRSLGLFITGNILYTAIFLLFGSILGIFAINYSANITIVLTGLFFILYFVAAKKGQKKYRFW
jgi:membrane protein DedA with SNARE-associated domain